MPKNAAPQPTEDEISITFAAWLRYQQGVKFTHIANEVWTPSPKQKERLVEMGMHAGLPDYLIVIDKKYQITAQDVMVWVELKRNRTCLPTMEQAAWINALNAVDGCEAVVAHSLEEAVAAVKKYLRNPRMFQ